MSARRKAAFRCPNCTHVLVKRTSYLSHPLLRHDVFVCSHPLCSASFSGHSELTGIVSPSGMPNAAVSDLPPTPACHRAIAERALREALSHGQLDIFDSCPSPLDN